MGETNQKLFRHLWRSQWTSWEIQLQSQCHSGGFPRSPRHIDSSPIRKVKIGLKGTTTGHTFSSTRPIRSSGLGRTSILGRPFTGALTRLSPNTSCMMDTIVSCCGMLQWTSAEMITGYGETAKAYFMTASQTSRNDTFEVSVLAW